MNNSDPGKIMRRARKKQGLTQAELAEKAGVSTMTIRRYESGDRKPRLEEALKISRALGLALKDLFSGPELDQMKHEVKQITMTLQGLANWRRKRPSAGKSCATLARWKARCRKGTRKRRQGSSSFLSV